MLSWDTCNISVYDFFKCSHLSKISVKKAHYHLSHRSHFQTKRISVGQHGEFSEKLQMRKSGWGNVQLKWLDFTCEIPLSNGKCDCYFAVMKRDRVENAFIMKGYFFCGQGKHLFLLHLICSCAWIYLDYGNWYTPEMKWQTLQLALLFQLYYFIVFIYSWSQKNRGDSHTLSKTSLVPLTQMHCVFLHCLAPLL